MHSSLCSSTPRVQGKATSCLFQIPAIRKTSRGWGCFNLVLRGVDVVGNDTTQKHVYVSHTPAREGLYTCRRLTSHPYLSLIKSANIAPKSYEGSIALLPPLGGVYSTRYWISWVSPSSVVPWQICVAVGSNSDHPVTAQVNIRSSTRVSSCSLIKEGVRLKNTAPRR